MLSTPGLWRFVVAPAMALLAAATLGWSAGPARAATAPSQATLADPAGDVRLSFTGSTDVTAASMSWDGTTLVASVVYAAPPASRQLSLLASYGTMDELDPTVEECDPQWAESLTIEAGADGNAVLELPFVDGVLSAAPETSTSNVVIYRFSSAALSQFLAPDRNDPFACLSGSADGDNFYGAFAGRVLHLNPAVARDGVRRVLAARVGARFENASKTRIGCPSNEMFAADEDSGARAYCRYEFTLRPGVFMDGTVTIQLFAGVPDETYFSKRTFSRKRVRCRLARTEEYRRIAVVSRSARATASMGCPRFAPLQIGDIDGRAERSYPRPIARRFKTFTHGTNTAGFDPWVVYRCRTARKGSRYRVDCGNEVGDRFTYSFTVRAKAAAPVSPPRPVVSPTPGGGTPGNVYNCDDFPLSDGTTAQQYLQRYPSDPSRLDADNDGLACENN